MLRDIGVPNTEKSLPIQWAKTRHPKELLERVKQEWQRRIWQVEGLGGGLTKKTTVKASRMSWHI